MITIITYMIATKLGYEDKVNYWPCIIFDCVCIGMMELQAVAWLIK